MSSKGKTRFEIRLSAEEHKALFSHAEAAGLTAADFVRSRCVKAAPKRARRRPETKDLHRILAQLGKIGSNINQLATVANQTGRVPELATLERIRAQVNGMAEQIDIALGYGSKG